MPTSRATQASAGLTPWVRSRAHESSTRPRSWARKDDHDEVTPANPGAGHPQAACGRSRGRRGQDASLTREGAGGLGEHVSPLEAAFGGMKADDAKRLKELERENARVKRIVADQVLEN